jgi:serine protease Do
MFGIAAGRPASLIAQAPAPREPSAQAVASALEQLTVEAIARAERSVVAIARLPRDSGRREELGGAAWGLSRQDPTDRAFLPQEFGSGVVLDASGLILTARHVVGDPQTAEYQVWVAGQPYPARLKAADPWFDLAVLQIDARNVTPIPLGDGQAVRKGQLVLALGNPYAIARDGRPSASLGIIANIDRQAPPLPAARGTEGRETLHHWGTLLQTDARLELGASGGALVNLQGEMIGLTLSLAALAGYERPGGFAIPVTEEFRRVVDLLKAGRVPDYGFLGVEPGPLTAQQRQAGRQGARVLDVVPATPAAAAGFQVGDLITHVDGRPISDRLDLFREVSSRLAGSTMTLQLLRGSRGSSAGRPLTLKVTLSKKRLETSRSSYAETPSFTWRGLKVDYATASPQFNERCRDLDPAGCVGVVEVARDSLAWQAGLRVGDFISHVAGRRVANPAEFEEAVHELSGEVTLSLTGLPATSAPPTRTVPAPVMPAP